MSQIGNYIKKTIMVIPSLAESTGAGAVYGVSSTTNVSLGYNSLTSITAGTGNTIIGNNSGQELTTGSNNTIIGSNITGLSAGLTGNIIIADGNGNIKAQHDGSKWSLTGGLMLPTAGTPGANKVLTSDASGNATWQVIPDTVSAESVARIAADATLTTNLNTEITNRTSAVATEATARANAYTTLTNNLNAEITARTNANTTLTTNLNAEIANRTSAVATEATARANADTTLTTNLNTEIANRTSAVATEATARANADTTLTNNLNAEITARTNADALLIPLTQKGAANGVATLDASGLVPAVQLPSYVDDVLEYTNLAGFPATGTTGKIYVALDTTKIYRWSGSAYVEISPSPGSTDAVPEGTTNLYYTTARAQSVVNTEVTARINAIATEATARIAADATLTSNLNAEITARTNADALLIPLTQKGAVNGVATLDASGLVTSSQLPTTVTATSTNTTGTYYPTFVSAAGSATTLYVDNATTALTYNPGTGTLTLNGPLATTSTSLVTNLNADMVDSKHVGTSGNTIPLLDGTNTWSNEQTFSKIKVAEQKYANSYTQSFSQSYSFGALAAYLTTGEYQEILTVTPSADSQNYDLIGEIVVQVGQQVQVIRFEIGLRSNVLPALAFDGYYTETLIGTTGFVKPVIWMKDTTTAAFKFAVAHVFSSVQNMTVKLDVVNRGAFNNVVMNTVVASETNAVPAGYTQYDLVKGITYDKTSNTTSFTGQVISSLANGTAPLSVTSTTLNTNLNADMLDGYHIGTTGATVPLLSTANTWGNNNTFSSNSSGFGVTITNAGTGKGLSVDDMTITSGLTISAGTPGANKVLTSDASGNATWQTPATYTLPAAATTTLGGAYGNFNTTYLTVALGYNVGGGGTGSGNILLGSQSGKSLTTGGTNVAIGMNALITATNALSNVAIGNSALELYNTSGGNRNVAIGSNAQSQANSGNYNVAVGSYALQKVSGSNNSAIGDGAGANLGSGSNNTLSGSFTGQAITFGTNNSFYGYNAGYNVSSGNNNTLIGKSTGLGITTGGDNTIIGANVAGLASGLTGNIILSDGAGSIKAQYDGSKWSLSGGLTLTGLLNIQTYTETKSVFASVTASTSLNLSLGTCFDLTLTQNTSITFTNVPSTANSIVAITIILRQDATGSRTVTWPTIRWQGGTTPTLTTTANKIDIVSLMTPDNGTTWFGNIAKNY